ncbi:hypothetical protein HMPREF2767_06995 [Nosocomiicoccus sp. HMSC067E10]|uniref:DUF402 domain-containing protein n=1 Tax=Nosocomiicoccus sp. HMSC067E10 TaxID=1739271 RepID=UPI0008A4AE12|nr:DUF402 domain-containing protein [Nosocomiicoccus sp. HMSC067E10]OFL48868.1 hypothetical protein HMPREF2767_06995 [Nosocomiicoccus sp. HMSC067E10]
MKTKYLNKKDWRRIRHSDYKEVLTTYEGKKVLIGCYYIHSVYHPLTVTIVGEKIKVADDNYKWITMMGEGDHYSLTVMFDENDEPVQYYFDINKSNTLELGRARREDLYLDVLALPDGRSELVDEDDIIRALKYGKVTPEERDFAYKIASDVERLIDYQFDEVVKSGQFMYEMMERENEI